MVNVYLERQNTAIAKNQSHVLLLFYTNTFVFMKLEDAHDHGSVCGRYLKSYPCILLQIIIIILRILGTVLFFCKSSSHFTVRKFCSFAPKSLSKLKKSYRLRFLKIFVVQNFGWNFVRHLYEMRVLGSTVPRKTDILFNLKY